MFNTIRARILYCAYEMQSTLSFALRREFAWDEMIRECQTHLLVIANIEGSSFRRPKNADEEAAWLHETTPQNTRNSTKWSVKIFEEWQSARSKRQMSRWALTTGSWTKFRI